MLANELARAPKARRWAVPTYLAAWRHLLEAAWRQELEDPLFRRAVDAAEADGWLALGDGASWLRREAWRDCIRSWWFEARHYYKSPGDIPDAWIIDQHERDAYDYAGVLIYDRPEREPALFHGGEAVAAYAARRNELWQRVQKLIASGDGWPLHLDPEGLARRQFDLLPTWAATAVSASACADWWRA